MGKEPGSCDLISVHSVDQVRRTNGDDFRSGRGDATGRRLGGIANGGAPQGLCDLGPDGHN
jgi:hypothetical protein